MPKVKFANHRKKQAKQTVENVLHRMLNEPERDFSKDTRQRSGVWYGRWKEMADFLSKNPSKAEILRYGFFLVEMCSGHGYRHVACSSAEMLELVILDKKL